MITGRQIREARALLQWGRRRFARKCSLPLDALVRAESLDDDAILTPIQNGTVRNALCQSGIEFVTTGDGGPGIRLRKPAVATLAQPPEGDA